MSTLNLNPVTKTDRPTSQITIQKRKVGRSQLVAAEHRNTTAYFYVEPVQEIMSSNLQNTVYLHENAAELYGGIDHGLPFRIDTDVGLNQVANCKTARLHLPEGNEKRLRDHLKAEKFLLHRGIKEVTKLDDSLVPFHVVDLEPSNYTTLVVTGETDIEFVDAKTTRSMGTAGAASQAGKQAGQDAAEMDIDIDVSPEKPTVSFEEDVAGLESVKETARMLLALFDPETRETIADRYGEGFVTRGGSMLLYGPPGCGKTLVSEAIAYEAANETNIEAQYGDVQFLPIKGGDILSRYPGEAERRVEAVFEEAHRVAQKGFAVLFFDEIETLIPDRSDDSLQRHERSLTNAFLQEMDTDKMEDNLLIIGATNMPFTIDPAASRRFPLQQFIPQPGAAVMSQVWESELSTLETASDDIEIDYRRLGEASVGYTPAEITDRVLGTDLQRDLIKSIIQDDREAVIPDTEYLLGRLENHRPKTVRQFVTSVRQESVVLEGYPEMQEYVEEQADRLDIGRGENSLIEQLAAAENGTEE